MNKQKLREFITRKCSENVKESYSGRREIITDENLDLYKECPKLINLWVSMSIKYLKLTRIKRCQ